MGTSKQVVQDDDVALADIIRQHRTSRGMNQATFAQLIGVSAATVGHLEAGTRSLSVEKVEQIADRLNLTGVEFDRLRAARDRLSVKNGGATVTTAAQLISQLDERYAPRLSPGRTAPLEVRVDALEREVERLGLMLGQVVPAGIQDASTERIAVDLLVEGPPPQVVGAPSPQPRRSKRRSV